MMLGPSGHPPAIRTAPPARRSRAGLYALAATLLVGGGGAAVLFAVDGQRDEGADPVTGPGGEEPAPVASAPTRVSSDFTITPDRPLFDSVGRGESEPSAASNSLAMPPQSAGADQVPQGIWSGGWYRAGTAEIDVPSGFSVGSIMGVVDEFAGDCGGAPCIIRVFGMTGQDVSPGDLAQAMRAIPAADGPDKPNKLRVGGRTCMSLVTELADEGLRGQMAICPGKPAVMMSVLASPDDFARTAGFRKQFFARRVRF
jgi:hypothetical protein